MPKAPRPGPGDRYNGALNMLTYDQQQAVGQWLKTLREEFDAQVRENNTQRQLGVIQLGKPEDMDEKTARNHSWWYLDQDKRTDGGFGTGDRPGPDGLPDYNTERNDAVKRQRDAKRQRLLDEERKRGGQPTSPVPTQPPPGSPPQGTWNIPKGEWGRQFDNRGSHGIPAGMFESPVGRIALTLFLNRTAAAQAKLGGRDNRLTE